jgi:predicted lipoprotein
MKMTTLQVQVTAALVHSCGMSFSLQPDAVCFSESVHTQETSSIERLPEENVSIVETLEGREERPETVRAIMNGTARRKLYFNPAYFEPELLVVSNF